MIKGIDVVFFYSKKLDNLTEWYKEMFGMDFSRNPPDADWAESTFPSGSPPARLAIHRWHGDVEQEFMISFLVEDLERLVQDLEDKGAELVGSPKIVEIEDAFYATVRDPEDNLIQLSQRK